VTALNNAEVPRKKKTVVIIVGASGAGKTTLRRAISGCSGEERKAILLCWDHKSEVQVMETASYTLFQNDLALAGNSKNGSDSVNHMDALRQVVDLCWQSRDVVIVDTLRMTSRFVRWLCNHPLSPAALFVFVNPPLDRNLAHLRLRRAARGIIETELPPRIFWNVFRWRERARSVWNYAHLNCRQQPVRFVEITGGTPGQLAAAVRKELELLHVE
jgi:energy-coupling factor transporter ATP-binding protein EcfA2